MAHHKYWVKEKATGHALADAQGTTLFCVDSDSVTAEMVLQSVAESRHVEEDTLEVVTEEPNIADGVVKAEQLDLPNPEDVSTAAALKRMIEKYGSLEAALEHL